MQSNGNTDAFQISILLVEDEEKLAHYIKRFLVVTGYSVDLVRDGVEALERISAKNYALVILDLNLPHKSGFEVLSELRRQSNTVPVLILSARDTVEDRVRGLMSGADDYLVKPFDSTELAARIQAILRRSNHTIPMTLRAADVTLDLLHHTVSRAGKEITLTPREYALLEFFVRNKNQILTRKRIAEQVWGYAFETGTNVVDVYVSYLRKAIDDGYPQRLIHTVHREGFIFKEQ